MLSIEGMLNFDACIKNSDAAQPRVTNMKTPIVSMHIFQTNLEKTLELWMLPHHHSALCSQMNHHILCNLQLNNNRGRFLFSQANLYKNSYILEKIHVQLTKQ